MRNGFGAFELHSALGEGGMGEVWRGRHVPSGAEVAIKLLTADRAREPSFLAAFRNEARLVASLDHPNVVRVLDFGVVDDAIAAQSRGALTAGSPYLAMELCAGGSLASFRRRLAWPQLRGCLRSLLDALAHAHARRVIHRDLKPTNVLLRGPVASSAFSAVTLTDFGIASVHGGEAASTAGTPGYMAPEQLEGRWRDQGPWTDLFGLGCLAWSLLCGAPPFRRGSSADTVAATLEGRLPDLDTLAPVPAELIGWLRRLLAPMVGDRFASAAEAAWALDALGEAEPGAGRFTPPEIEILATRTTRSIPDRAGIVGPRLAPGQLSVPGTWRGDARGLGRLHRGMELGLFGLRAVPVVGREVERDLLWTVLRDVAVTRRGRAIVLRGASGLGKTHLADWLCHRALETGVALDWRVAGAPLGRDEVGLVGMLRSGLRVDGLAPRHVPARLARLLGDDGELVEIATGLLASDDEPGGDHRLQGVLGVIGTVSAPRVALVVVDDAQWSLDGVQLAQVAVEVDVPVLIVLTVRDEAVGDRREVSDALRALLSTERVDVLDLDPLPASDQRRLVQELVDAGPALSEALVQRTAGNPMFMVHLLQEWVGRGALVRGPSGYELADPHQELPADLAAVWAGRLRAALEGRPAGDRVALEVAAALGQHVDTDLWREACAQEQLGAPTELVEALWQHRLAVSDAEGPSLRWSFVHGAVREVIEVQAREAGRWSAHNAACAAAMRLSAFSRAAERRALHHLEAEQHALALPLLRRAVRDRGRAGEWQIAHQLAERYLAAVRRLGEPEDGVENARAQLMLGNALRLGGNWNAAERHARRAESLSRALGDEALLFRALGERIAVALFGHAEMPLARALGLEAEQLARASSDPEKHSVALRDLGIIGLEAGDVAGAEQWFLRSLEAAESTRQDSLLGFAALGVAMTAVRGGRLEQAERHAERAMLAFRRSGLLAHVASCLNLLAEVARARGDLPRAEALYRRALRRTQWVGGVRRGALGALLNLALLAVLRDRYDEAWDLLADIDERRIAHGERLYLLLLRLPAAALRGLWRVWDSTMEQVVRAIEQGWAGEADAGEMLAIAGKVALGVGERGRAAQCGSLARRVWEVAGTPERAGNLEGMGLGGDVERAGAASPPADL